MRREDPRRDLERAAFSYTLCREKSFEGGIHMKFTSRKCALLALSALAVLTLTSAACARPGPGFHGGPPPSFGHGPGFRPAPPPRRDWRPAPPPFRPGPGGPGFRPAPPPRRDWRPAPPPPPRRDWHPAPPPPPPYWGRRMPPPPPSWHRPPPPPPRYWRHHRDRDDFLFLFPFLFTIAAGCD